MALFPLISFELAHLKRRLAISTSLHHLISSHLILPAPISLNPQNTSITLLSPMLAYPFFLQRQAAQPQPQPQRQVSQEEIKPARSRSG